MNKDQFKNLQAKLESIWNEDSFIVNDAPGQAPAGTAGQPGSDANKLSPDQIKRRQAPDQKKRNQWRISQDLAKVSEATQGPGVDAVMELIDMGVSKEDLFDQMMRDHSDDELLSFADDYRRMNDIQD
jgi:hypothetical protein